MPRLGKILQSWLLITVCQVEKHPIKNKTLLILLKMKKFPANSEGTSKRRLIKMEKIQ